LAKNGLYAVHTCLFDGVKGRASGVIIPSGRPFAGFWHRADGQPKHRFSRDIAPAGGYLMASRPVPLYTAVDRAKRPLIRAAATPKSMTSQQTMKATRPLQ
jgi:hypothetical protein